MVRILFLLLCTPCPLLLATASWYEGKLEGWYYFEDRESQEAKKAELSPEEADEIIHNEKRKLAQLLSLALLVPSPENVASYMREQKKWLDQSGRFAGEWEKIILDYPLLGEFFKNPTTSYGILAKKEIDLKKRKQLLHGLSKDHFLLFVFRGRDAFSQQAAEVVKLFASVNQWKVKALSLDGQGLKEYPEFEVDKGISQVIGVKAAPSLFVINPLENKVVPVGAGLVSVSDIEENIEIQFKEGGLDD
jgi:conjugal transfer pilus assembly protein TraF